MKGKFLLPAWLLPGVLAAGLLALGLPWLLRQRGGTSALPPLSSLPPVPTPTPSVVPTPSPTPTPTPTLPRRLGQAVWLAPLRLRMEVAARAGNYLYWDEFQVHRNLRRADAIPALRGFLDDPDVFVRMRAAQLLAQVGDYSGDAVLWQIAHAPSAVMVNAPDARRQKLEAQDIRDYAIYSLAKRGFKEVAPLCVRSFERTGRMEYAVLAAELGAREVIPALVADAERGSREAGLHFYYLETFGRAKAQEARPFIEARFNDQRRHADKAVKNRAAWAMIQLGEREPFYDYLLQEATQAVEIPFAEPRRDGGSDARDALRHLATIHNAEVQALLERALECPDHEVQKAALISLCMDGWNPPSEAVRRKLVSLLSGTSCTPLWMELAAHSQDPEVRAAAGGLENSGGDRTMWQDASEEWVYWPNGFIYGVDMVR